MLCHNIVTESVIFDRKFEKKTLHYENFCLDTNCISVVCVINIENGYRIYHNNCPFIKNGKTNIDVYISNYDNAISKYEKITNEELMNVIGDYKGLDLIKCDEDRINRFCYNYHDNYLELYNKTNDELIIFNGIPLIKPPSKMITLITLIIIFMIELIFFHRIILAFEFDTNIIDGNKNEFLMSFHFECGITISMLIMFFIYFIKKI
jgi:hypothetical protein